MQFLPRALQGLGEYPQFILCRLTPDTERPGKTIKMPIDYRTLQPPAKGTGGAMNPGMWLGFTQASGVAASMGEGYAVGFVFTRKDPFFFLDIDNCFGPDGRLSDVANYLMQLLPGAGVELSQSQQGLHVIGTGVCPEHGCKNVPLGIELYTQDRFVVLTGLQTIGDVRTDCSLYLPGLVETYFSGALAVDDGEWNTVPVDMWEGPVDDDVLLEKAMSTASAAAIFGSKASFRDLFEANEEVLATVYPDAGGKGRPYDESSADAALAQHLAFWTGNNHERIQGLMWRSNLVRDKWDMRSEYYLPRTIRRAVSRQQEVYNNHFTSSQPLPASPMHPAAPHVPTVTAALPPGSGGDGALPPVTMQLTSGYQLMDVSNQMSYFEGCVYVRDVHRVWVPDGSFLKPDQFKATYGGYVFALDNEGQKTTKNAWEVLTESQAVRFPKVHRHTFRPELAAGAIVQEEGYVHVNTYVPVQTRRVPGDPAPFLEYLTRVLPYEQDRLIALYYMAGVLQYPGVKFQYCPVIQGAEGNGKTTILRVLAHGCGHRYSHLPNSQELAKSGGKFTGWMERKLFIGVDELKVPNIQGGLLDALKPMITNDRIEIQGKGVDQVMGDNRANWLMLSNYKDAIPVTSDTRRYSVMFSAQQSRADCERDGLTGTYFPQLYDWLKADGYAIINDYLRRLSIPDELNPAMLGRAPETTSTPEAIELTMGEIDQQIAEAIGNEFPGFRGGWVSSIALEKFLEQRRMGRALPPNKRRATLQALGYDWHPGLVATQGRVNNSVVAEGGKPKLFIQKGHISANLTGYPEITAAYEKAQGYNPSMTPEQTFSQPPQGAQA